MTDSVPISGFSNAPFSGVSTAFAQNFAEDLERGAGFSVFLEGECVVDLRGGWRDRAEEEPFTEETLACIFSSGKAAIAMLVARAVSEGKLDYEAPVAQYWPEFAAEGKDAITVAEALSHQAGLCGIPDQMPPEDWLDHDRICARLAAMKPLWTPGAAAGYHPQTFGFIAGELLKRATGRSVGQMLREDFTEEHGLDLHCGMTGEEIARAAYMSKPPKAPDLGELTELKRIAFLKPWSAPAKMSREKWMAAELPASNMHATARALADIAHPLANGGLYHGKTIIGPGVLDAAFQERISGDDLVLPFNLSWAAGVMRNNQGHFGPSRAALGHAGFGGSSVMFDPARKLSAAYAMTKMSPCLVGDPRFVRLIEAVYAAL